MQLYGIALLPEKQISQEIINFQHRHLDFFKEPELSLTGFLPHMSILQCPFDPKLLTVNFDQIYNFCHDFAQPAAMLDKIIVHQNSWKFLTISIQPWMHYLQANLIELTSSMIERWQIKKPHDFNYYSTEEQNCFTQYGYPYIGTAFLPHITLGRSTQTIIPTNIQQDALQYFNKRSFNFEKLVIYQAGKNGALANVLNSITL